MFETPVKPVRRPARSRLPHASGWTGSSWKSPSSWKAPSWPSTPSLPSTTRPICTQPQCAASLFTLAPRRCASGPWRSLEAKMSRTPHGGPPAGSGTRSDSSRVPVVRTLRFGNSRGAGVPTPTRARAARATPVAPETIARPTINGRVRKRPRQPRLRSSAWLSAAGHALGRVPELALDLGDDAHVDSSNWRLSVESPRLTRLRITNSDVWSSPAMSR